jgi:hypothetical protein
MTVLFLLLFLWLAVIAGLLFYWRGQLRAFWREPVFKSPILIVESDDWGAGPTSQAEALLALSACLGRHHDAYGRSAQMTLALILAIPKPNMAGQITLADAIHQPVLNAILAGKAQGVFALQLHGMMHFWPDALQKAATKQPEVQAWLSNPVITENLPSPLQSRWTNAASLPSTPHTLEALETAVAEEVDIFNSLFSHDKNVGAASAANSERIAALKAFAAEAAPTGVVTSLVVVPPTFVWDARVEAAWAKHGVGVVITPGRRLTGRDANGKPAGQDKTMLNGDRGEGDVLYLVRDDYFEPIFGHRPEQAIAALARKTALGRPCLLETHRWNFLTETGGDPPAALAALDDLYTRALHDFPALRFASCAELGQAIRTHDGNWIEQDRHRRFTIWLHRIASLPRFGKAARLTGLLFILNLFAQPDHRRS